LPNVKRMFVFLQKQKKTNNTYKNNMDFNLLVRFFLLLFCLEGFPLPGGEACLPLRLLAAQVTSLLWSCNMMLYPRRHPVTDHIKRMVPAPSAKLKDPTQAREQRFPCLQNSTSLVLKRPQSGLVSSFATNLKNSLRCPGNAANLQSCLCPYAEEAVRLMSGARFSRRRYAIPTHRSECLVTQR